MAVVTIRESTRYMNKELTSTTTTRWNNNNQLLDEDVLVRVAIDKALTWNIILVADDVGGEELDENADGEV